MDQHASQQPQHAPKTAPGADRRSVLLVFGERDTATMLAEAYAFHGLEGVRVSNGAEALAWVQAHRPELIVMDLAQPDVDGLVLCADLRARAGAPIIVCGDAVQRREALLAFRLGADDFVPKPFDVDDLLARSEVALRRSARSNGQSTHSADGHGAPPASTEAATHPASSIREDAVPGAETALGASSAPGSGDVSSVGALALDQTHHRVTVAGREVRLSRSEYLLLGALMGRPDELLSRLDLARAVWGEQLASVGRPIDQHMYRLRSKLQQAARAGGVRPPTIVSVPGFGYRLLAEESAAELRRAG
jgi:DNA-binding response OmpR family regulator